MLLLPLLAANKCRLKLSTTEPMEWRGGVEVVNGDGAGGEEGCGPGGDKTSGSRVQLLQVRRGVQSAC
jgi:hypothetical protein